MEITQIRLTPVMNKNSSHLENIPSPVGVIIAMIGGMLGFLVFFGTYALLLFLTSSFELTLFIIMSLLSIVIYYLIRTQN